jgi:hypothetical protein
MGTSDTLRVVGVAGSLRQASYNRALLRAAQELAPERLKIEIHDLAGIPLYNEDVETAGVPQAVTDLRQAIAAADGLLIATPEYNHGVPGVMKNAFDWLSRPPRKSVLQGKPTAPHGGHAGDDRHRPRPEPAPAVFRVHRHSGHAPARGARRARSRPSRASPRRPPRACTGSTRWPRRAS